MQKIETVSSLSNNLLQQELIDHPQTHIGERPSHYAGRIGNWYSSNVSISYRKTLGQYFTPVEVADFMASLSSSSKNIIRIIDPGAGTGILSCSVCEHLAGLQKRPSEIILDVYESDMRLCEVLNKTLSHLSAFIKEQGISLNFTIHSADFILSKADWLRQTPLFPRHRSEEGEYDICIANPPYFKLQKTDIRSKAASSVVHGQPNIYALFMAISASILKENGELIFITPRSFTSGIYFRLFREKFFETMRPEHIHIFESRRDAFKKEGVLQENIIIKARREQSWQAHHKNCRITISSSTGAEDIKESRQKIIPLKTVLDIKTKEKILKIPTNGRVARDVRIIQQWTGSLLSYGLEISTGPIVAFRCTRYIYSKEQPGKTYAPLLWMQNIKPMSVLWPNLHTRKPQFIEIRDDSLRLMVPNKNYVLIRRFSAKEEPRRLIAAPFIGKNFSAELLGLENHLNYIYRPKGSLTEQEACGLAALFNSTLMDSYFRTLNGNTQVGSIEIRAIPLPPIEIISEIGQIVMSQQIKPDDIDTLINAFLKERRSK